MTLPFAGDLDAFFGDFSVVVIYGATTTSGIFDMGTRAEDFMDRGNGLGLVMVDDPSVLVKTSLGVEVNDAISVDGTSYIVRNRESSADGQLMRLFIREATS